jgi:hypothetical protein
VFVRQELGFMNLLDGGPVSVGNALIAVGALGTASFGLVDVCKSFWNGGPSSAGFSYIEKALAPFGSALAQGAGAHWAHMLKSHWINGAALDDQKAKAKALIRLGLTPHTAATMAKAPSLAERIDAAAFELAATKIADGEHLTEVDLNVLGRFDAMVSAALDAGFERADQRYRSVARLLACLIAIVLAVLAAWLIDGQAHKPVTVSDIAIAVFIGLVSTPLAPVAKDLAKTLNTAAAAFKAAKG